MEQLLEQMNQVDWTLLREIFITLAALVFLIIVFVVAVKRVPVWVIIQFDKALLRFAALIPGTTDDMIIAWGRAVFKQRAQAMGWNIEWPEDQEPQQLPDTSDMPSEATPNV